MESEKPSRTQSKPEPLLPNLLFNVVLPIVILGQGDRVTDRAGLVLIVALAFPVVYFFYDLKTRGKTNFISILGFVSVLLTGGVGLLELPRFWFILKEAAIPALIGTAVLISMFTPYPLIRALVYSRQLFDVDRIQEHLEERGTASKFNRMLRHATGLLSLSFFLSAALNYFVASYFVKTEPKIDPAQFNAEVSRMTGWSYVIIALPSMLFMMAIVFWLIKGIHRMTGLTLEECFAPEHRAKMEEQAKSASK
jgi:hypothetical protein